MVCQVKIERFATLLVFCAGCTQAVLDTPPGEAEVAALQRRTAGTVLYLCADGTMPALVSTGRPFPLTDDQGGYAVGGVDLSTGGTLDGFTIQAGRAVLELARQSSTPPETSVERVGNFVLKEIAVGPDYRTVEVPRLQRVTPIRSDRVATGDRRFSIIQFTV